MITFCQIAFNFHLLPLCLLLHLILGLFLWKRQNRTSCVLNNFSGFCNLRSISAILKIPYGEIPLLDCFCGCCWAGRHPLTPSRVSALELSLSDLCFCSFASVGDLLCLCRHTLVGLFFRWILHEYCCVDNVDRDFLVLFFLTSFV